MFSVITPAYNAEKYIAEAIESVQSQGLETWEMLVIDDGSTDGTRQVVEQFAAKDPRVKLIQNNHGGVSHARNSGIKQAKYEWIALLDADDAFCPNKMKKQLDAIEKDPAVVLWGTYAYNIGEDGKIFDVCEDGPTSHAAFQSIRKSAGIVSLKASSALFRAELFHMLGGFDSQYDSSEDAELWNRMSEHGSVLVIPEPLVLYRFHPNSLSVRKMRFQYDFTRFLRARNKKRLIGGDLLLADFMKEYQARSVFAKMLDWSIMHSNAYWRLAGIQLTNRRKAKGAGMLAMAFITNPPMIAWRILRKIGGRLRFSKAHG